MTVAELIKHLQALPNQDQRVVLLGYEGGYWDITSTEEIGLVLNVNTAWYYGPHESVSDYDDAKPDETAYYLS